MPLTMEKDSEKRKMLNTTAEMKQNNIYCAQLFPSNDFVLRWLFALKLDITI